MRHLLVLERAAHLEVEGVADEDERDVVVRVGVALSQLVGPDDRGVVEQAPGAAGFGYAIIKDATTTAGFRFDPWYVLFGRNSVINPGEGGGPIR